MPEVYPRESLRVTYRALVDPPGVIASRLGALLSANSHYPKIVTEPNPGLPALTPC